MNERKIYICTIDWSVFDEIIKYNIWGVKDRAINQISKINTGDLLLFYIKIGKYNNEKMKPSIYGIFEVSTPFKNINKSFDKNSKLIDYPNKLIFKEFIKIEEPKLFKPIINQLSFIKNKERWGLVFMGRSITEITPTDYTIIKEYLV